MYCTDCKGIWGEKVYLFEIYAREDVTKQPDLSFRIDKGKSAAAQKGYVYVQRNDQYRKTIKNNHK